jgi:hypothetical protein
VLIMHGMATGDEENEALERCNYSGAATSKSQTHARYDFFCARSVTCRMTSFTAPEGVRAGESRDRLENGDDHYHKMLYI